MPSDPTFETREALEAWVKAQRDPIRTAISLRQLKEVADRIYRVTLAHAHLLEDRNDD